MVVSVIRRLASATDLGPDRGGTSVYFSRDLAGERARVYFGGASPSVKDFYLWFPSLFPSRCARVAPVPTFPSLAFFFLFLLEFGEA